MEQNRSINVDVVRVTAMLMVIVMHTMLSFTLRPDFFATKLWFILEPLVAVSHVCVLLFFMLSGYLILSKDRSIPEILGKTFKRLFVPLLIFESLNILYAYWRFGTSSGKLELFFYDQLERLINYPSSPLWFLVVLIYLYLMTPLLSKVFSKQGDRKIAIYITVLAFLLSIVPTPLAYITERTGSSLTNFTSWTVFICFYFYGALVKNKWVNISNQKINYLLFLFGTLFTIIGDYVGVGLRITLNNPGIPIFTQAYTALPLVMVAIGLFNILMSYDFNRLTYTSTGRLFVALISTLAVLSYGIYLLHTYVVSVFSDILQFDFDHLSMNVYLYNIVNFGLVLGISAALTAVILRIPKLRFIIGGSK